MLSDRRIPLYKISEIAPGEQELEEKPTLYKKRQHQSLCMGEWERTDLEMN